MISCITINLKYKLKKQKNLKIDYFIEKRFSNENMSKILNDVIEKQTKILIIEEISILNVSNKLNIIKYLREKNIKVLILYFNRIKFIEYFNISFFNLVNMKNIDYHKNILKIYKKDFTKKDLSLISKDEKIEDDTSEQLSIEYVILGLALDRKMYLTTFLSNLAYFYSQNYNVNFFEKDQSIILIENLINFNELDIKYHRIKEISDTFENIKKGKINVTIYDLGMITESFNFKDIQYNEIIAFLSEDQVVVSSPKYQQYLKELKKLKNIQYVFKNDIINKYIKDKNLILPYKKNKKYIEKYLETVVITEV